MSVLQVLHIPDERLRKVAKPVEEVNAISINVSLLLMFRKTVTNGWC